ncbi:MAG TPA: TonB-dependent receptor [Bacteroidales bacterium]|nr:TonB-dependent receptor [Bacteroidales bacterium]
MKGINIYLLYFLMLPGTIIGQQINTGELEGRVFNVKNNEPVPFANVVIYKTTIGSASNFDGKFLFTGIKPGFIKIQVSAVGFKTYFSEEIMVTNAKKVFLNIPLEETSIALDEVVVKPSPFRKTEESPVSLRRIGIQDIEKSPGANRDISKVIQSFPGVASTPVQRNDVIVRGGGPSENSFYLDGVEIPNINHFATQGASGGPVGIINVDFIREVDFYSGAFPANRGNALSSILEFKQKDGNKEKLETQGTLGASEVALTFDGPLTENTTFIFSARRSYLQILFAALELPFLPTYNDAQVKIKTRFDEKNELTLIGLGAIDQFDLNLDANDTEDQRYILNYIPVNEQWSYTVGAVYKHYREKSYDTWVLSRNALNNRSYKYLDNIEVDSLLTFDYLSEESETKFRYENTTRSDNGYKINYGAGAEYAKYTNTTFRKLYIGDATQTINYNTNLDLWSWSVFGQISKEYLGERLSFSLGARADANNYSSEMSNLFSQFSPRFSASYQIKPDLSVNFNTGRYYQRPAYTTLGFSDGTGNLINKSNGLKYISVDHLVGGFEYLPNDESVISLEGFYKYYRDYPFSVNDSIALSNKGADYGSFGDEEVLSVAEGQAYGLELLARHRNLWGFNLVLSYTLVRSEFKEFDDNLNLTSTFIPSSWDNIHLLNLTATRDLKRNWQFGFKWRFVGGSPYTPFDENKSSLINAWNARGREYLDYTQFNALRLDPFHQLDIRIDKQYFFEKWSLMFYIDVQNVYNFKSDEPDKLITQTDQNGNILIDPNDPKRYDLKRIESDGTGTVLPSLGIIVQF